MPEALNAISQAHSIDVKSRMAAMLCISLGVFVASLDTAITNTALPTISKQLKCSPADVIWVVSSYQLLMVGAMLPLVAFGEKCGHRKVFGVGLILFTVTSLLCGVAGSLRLLIAARALQGFGAAAIIGANAALVKQIYPPEKLGKGLGLNALVVASGLASGPVVASGILAISTWHWLFYLNIPVGVVAMVLVWKLPPQKLLSSQSFDVFSATLCFAVFSFFIHALGALVHIASAVQVGVELLMVLLCGLVLVRREIHKPFPILPVDLFQNRLFSLTTATAVAAFTVQGLALVALPFFFHSVLNRAPVEVGLLIAPWPFMGAMMAPVAGSLSDRISAAALGGLGLLILGGALATLTLLRSDINSVWIALCMMFCGLGFGLFLSPNQKILMSSAPKSRGGSASGILGTSRLLGQAIGAVLVALALSQSQMDGSVHVLWLGVVIALVGASVSLSRLC